MVDLPTALYVINNVSFCCHQYVPANALRNWFPLDAHYPTYSLCLLNNRDVSTLTANIFGLWTSGSYEYSMSILGWIAVW